MSKPLIARVGAVLRRNPHATRILDRRMELRRTALDRRFDPRDAERLEELRERRDLRLNVGSGDDRIPGWLSVDLLRDPSGEVIKLDATQPWPFAPGSALAVNSEHFIEHLTLDQARAFLTQAFLVLSPGGAIRTSTPDLEGMCAAYVAADPGLLMEHRGHGYEARSPGDLVNNYFYMHGHRHIHDLDSLRHLYQDAGFTEVTRADFGESRHELLRGIDSHDLGPLRSLALAVDAVKPAGPDGAAPPE